MRERTRRCVTESAQETTPGSAASAPKMRVCSGGLGLRPHPRPRCELDPVDSGYGSARLEAPAQRPVCQQQPKGETVHQATNDPRPFRVGAEE